MVSFGKAKSVLPHANKGTPQIRMSQITEYVVEVCWSQCTQSGAHLIPVFGGLLERDCVRHCRTLFRDAIKIAHKELVPIHFRPSNRRTQFCHQAGQLVETYQPFLRAGIYYWPQSSAEVLPCKQYVFEERTKENCKTKK